MKSLLFLLILGVLFNACIGKNSVAIKSKSPKATTTTSSSSITVVSVKLVNNQFVLTGTNLASATSVVIKESGSIMTLAIESQSASTLTANGLANLTLAAGKVFEFIVSSASASATFTVDFSLCSSTLGGKAFDCTTTPNDKEVLAYDANSGKWKPKAVNGLSYKGVWDATTSFPTATAEGDYYIVSVASGSYAIGDWIVYNGTTFEEIDNSTVVTSVFGRTGAVTANEGDYVLGKMGDVDFTATPTTNQVLQFNGTNWVGATLSTVETDPNVKTFAKTTLPTCGSSEVLKGDGTSLSCVTVSSGSGSFSGTANRAMVTDGTGALAVSAVTATELGYVSGVTSAIQTQISAFQAFAKTPIPTCNAGEVLKSNGTTFSCVTDNTGSGAFSGTASRAVVTDGSGTLSSSAVTSTEVGYLSGVTSAIQTQFTNVAATAAAINTTSTTLTNGNIFVGSVGNVATSVTMSGDATIANTGALTIANNAVALSTDTTGNYVLNLTASNGLQATAAAGEGTTPNLVLGGTLTGATTFTQGTNNVLFDLTSTGIFSVLAGANGLSVSNLGVTTLSSAVLTTADINGGTLDDVTIGATTRAPGSFTTISGTSAAIAGTASVGTLLTSNILGGTTTTSELNFKTTSGVGTTTADMHFLVGNNGGTEALTILNNGNIGIGIATPQALLEMSSTTSGFLPPRMDSTQRDAITTPATGLTIFNTTTGFLEVYNGSAWLFAGQSIPTGAIMAFASTTCPTGWSEYTPSRGRFLRGIDTNAEGIDPDGTRIPGTPQTDAFQGHVHRTAGDDNDGNNVTAFQATGSGINTGIWGFSTGTPYTDGTNGVPRTASETRPKNVAVLYCEYSGGNGASLATGANQIIQGNSSVTATDSGANGAITLTTEGSERMRIDPTGNVGIGNANPTQKLSVAGVIESTTGGVKFPDGNTVSGVSYTQLESTSAQTFLSNSWTAVTWSSAPIASGITYSGSDITFTQTGVYRVTLGFRGGGGGDVWSMVRLYGNGSSRGHGPGFGLTGGSDSGLFNANFLVDIANAGTTYQIQIGRLAADLTVIASSSVGGETTPSLQATIEKVH